MTHLATPFLLLVLSLLSIAHALPPLTFAAGSDSAPAAGWIVDAATFALEHAAGEASLLLRGGRVLGVSGVVDGGAAGAEALVSLIVAARGGGEALARDLEHHLSKEAVPPVTRIGNALLTLREVEGRVAFDFALIELAPGDFRATRHVVNRDGLVPVRIYGDMASAHAAAFTLGTLPALLRVAEEVGLRLEYHHAPVSPSGVGVLAAEASECVAAAHPETGFWAFLDLLARERVAWASLVAPQEFFVEAAGRLGLGAPGLAACIEGRLARREVSVASESAASLGLLDRPTVFVGGFLMQDPGDVEELSRLAALARPMVEAAAREAADGAGVVPLLPAGQPE